MNAAIVSRCRFWIALGAGLCAAGSALPADNPNCTDALSALSALKSKPFHVYMTTEDKFSSARLSNAAGSIGMTGVKKSEEIWTGKDVFVMTRAKWVDMQTNFTEMNKGGNSDSEKVRKNAQCKALPDEVAFGQPAFVYQIHQPQLGIDTRVWVSKATRLPLKSEMTQETGPMKSLTSSRYEYENVHPPANAMFMRDMVKPK